MIENYIIKLQFFSLLCFNKEDYLSAPALVKTWTNFGGWTQ